MEKIQEILNNGLEKYEKENKIIGYKKKEFPTLELLKKVLVHSGEGETVPRLYNETKKFAIV